MDLSGRHMAKSRRWYFRIVENAENMKLIKSLSSPESESYYKMLTS